MAARSQGISREREWGFHHQGARVRALVCACARVCVSQTHREQGALLALPALSLHVCQPAASPQHRFHSDGRTITISPFEENGGH